DPGSGEKPTAAAFPTETASRETAAATPETATASPETAAASAKKETASPEAEETPEVTPEPREASGTERARDAKPPAGIARGTRAVEATGADFFFFKRSTEEGTGAAEEATGVTTATEVR